MAEAKAATAGEIVLLDHTDCDNILSAAILGGAIEPLLELGEAAIVADHIGEVNAIAELLQSLDKHRDYAYLLDYL